MVASDYDAQAIRAQLFELSEHILRRLAILLARARANAHTTYPDFEATARDLSNVQRQLRDELGRPWPRREEREHLMALMRVQERCLLLLEELETLPFNQVAGPSQTILAVAQQPFCTQSEKKIAPWPEDSRYPEPPQSGSLSRPSVAPEISGSPRRLQTRSSVGQSFTVVCGQAPVRAWPRTPDPVEPSPRRRPFGGEGDDMVEIAASADPDGYMEPPPSEPSRRLSARPAPERTGSPDGLQTRSSAEPYYSLKSRQAPVRSRPRTPDPAEPSPRPPARVGRSRERPLSNPPSNRMSPLLRCGGPPTAPASRVAISPVSPPEHQRAAALPVPASAPTDRQSDIADLSRRSAKERIRIRLGAVWYSFRHLLQILVTAAFVVLGIVALALVGRLAIMVSQGLNTPESEMVNQQRVDERLPTEDANSVSADALGKKLMPSTGDAFVVVLSMHPDAATAQHMFAEMRQTMGATLTDLQPDIQPVETPNGIRYRLALASPMSRERAFAMCSDFKVAGFHACWLRRLQR